MSNYPSASLTINKKVSVNKILKKLKEEFIRYSKEKEENTIKYIDRLIFYNKIGHRYYTTSYSLKEAYKREYNYIYSVCDYINKKAISEGYIPVFTTLTLPSDFHLSTTRTGKRVFNHKFNNKFKYNELSYIKEGYNILQHAFRIIAKNLTRGNKSTGRKNYYFKVIEMHKDFTPHLHFVIFIHKDEFIYKFEYLLKTITKLVEDGILGEQYKVELLKNKDRGAAYVQKYLRKAYLTENDDDIYLLDGWRKMNRIRMFTHSQTYLKKADFIKILPDFVSNEEEKIKECL